MSTDTITINAEPRPKTGTSHSKRLRRAGQFPGILYSKGNEGVNVAINEHEYTMKLKGHPSENLILDVELEGKTHTVLLREVQHDCLTGKILHVDFNEVTKGQKLKVNVTVELFGEAVGVKAGGVLETLVHSVEVECLPKDLMELIRYDVTDLDVGQHALVSDLPIDREKIAVLTPGDVAIANVAAPRVKEEDVDTGEVDAAGEAGEEDSSAEA